MSTARLRLANAAHAAMLQRAELQRNLGLTQSALKPKSLTARGKFHAKSAAYDAADFARDEIRTHRLPLAVAAVAAGAWMLRRPMRQKGPQWLRSCGQTIADLAASVSRQLDPNTKCPDAQSSAKAESGKLRQPFKTLVQKARKTTKNNDKFQDDMEEKMKPLGQTARDTRDKATELAEKAADSARQTAEAAKLRVQDGYGRARDVTSDLAADLAAKGREQAGVAKDAANAALAKGRENAKIAGSRFRDFADDQPLTLLAGALAAGLVIGSLFSSRNKDVGDQNEEAE